MIVGIVGKLSRMAGGEELGGRAISPIPATAPGFGAVPSTSKTIVAAEREDRAAAGASELRHLTPELLDLAT